MVNLNTGILKSLRVPCPPLSVQRKLVKVIAAQREIVDLEMEKIEELRLLKQGLMDDLLTGKVRVPEAEAVLEGL